MQKLCIPWSGRRLWAGWGLLVLAVMIGVFVARGRRHGARSPAEAKNTPSADTAIPPPTPPRPVLDLRPHQWKSMPIVFDEAIPFRFQLDEMPPPDARSLKQRRSTLVRPAPYPYFTVVSIPSDCCGSTLSDVFYTQTLLSRQYGLDFPSSFFPFSCDPAVDRVVLFLGEHAGLTPGTMGLEDRAIDRLPLQLTYYYRGWLDHVHQWSNEAGSFHSLVVPRRLTVGTPGRAVTECEMAHVGRFPFQGFELGIEVDDGIRSFELEILDGGNERHSVVFGQSLEDRPGWDVSHLSREELRRFYIYLGEERHRNPGSVLGRSGTEHAKRVTFTVRGSDGAAAGVSMLRPFDLTRDMVRRQMEVMRSWNIAPIASTYHGGFSSWTQITGKDPTPWAYTDPILQRQIKIDRPSLGASPGTPAYMTDLLADFGIVYHNVTRSLPPTRHTTDQMAFLERLDDGSSYYRSSRWWYAPTPIHPDFTLNDDHFENLGCNLVRFLDKEHVFGEYWFLYTHFNLYNAGAFKPPDTTRQMNMVKRLHPFSAAALALLSNLKHDLDGRRQYHQRLWCCPLSVALRFGRVVRHLERHARLDENDVRIKSWRDEVTNTACPDPDYLTQDLHGQTFYVPDSRTGRVFCDGREITSLKRNPADFTGRQSVTVVDTHTPSILFDEARLEDMGGKVELENAALSYRSEAAPLGRLALEITCRTAGTALVTWTPPRFDTHETDFLRFLYRKSNPQSNVFVSWTDAEGREFVATQGERAGRQGWTLPAQADGDEHDVVLEFADMQAPRTGAKQIPRGRIREVRFGLCNARPGDTLVLDRVEFLSARGLRPSSGTSLVVGGQLLPERDGVCVRARSAGKTWETKTVHNGWYIFKDIPRDSVLEISCELAGKTLHPQRGRCCQIGRNDLEFHIIEPE